MGSQAWNIKQIIGNIASDIRINELFHTHHSTNVDI